jgi:hypothetical protein
MKKMQKGGVNPGKKKARLEKRANRVMSRAQKTYAESLGAIEDAKKSGTKADVGGAEQLQNRSLRQEARAKKIKAKASTMKTGGMVNTNTKASVLKKAGTNGVNPGVNPKAKASTVAKGRVGGTSTAPKDATPKAQYGRSMKSSMKKGGSVKK